MFPRTAGLKSLLKLPPAPSLTRQATVPRKGLMSLLGIKRSGKMFPEEPKNLPTPQSEEAIRERRNPMSTDQIEQLAEGGNAKIPWSGLLLGLLLAAPLPALAQDESRERFQLYTRCAEMGLQVQLDRKDDDLGDLTTGQIEQAVRSRLRAARLYRETGYGLLSVRVLTVERAFTTQLYFLKPVRDAVSGMVRFAVTWHRVGVGTYGSDGGNYVISTLSQAMDGFIDEYLRVNEAACASLGTPVEREA